MSTHVTEDGTEVEATFFDEGAELPPEAVAAEVVAPVWVVEYEDEVRYCHPNAFDDNYTEIGD